MQTGKYVPPHARSWSILPSLLQRDSTTTSRRSHHTLSEQRAHNTKQIIISDNCYGDFSHTWRTSCMVTRKDLVPGLILYLPDEKAVQGSKVPKTGDSWHGVYNHPVVVRDFGEVDGTLMVEFHPLVSFNGKPISESYAEGKDCCRKDRERAMLIEHADNRTGPKRGAWDNTDCLEKLQFDTKYGETERPTYVRLDKILWIEVEYLLRPFKCTDGCRLDPDSISMLMDKRRSPPDSPLSKVSSLAVNWRSQVTARDLERLRRSRKIQSEPGTQSFGRSAPFRAPGRAQSSTFELEAYTVLSVQGSDTSETGSQSSTDTELSDSISELSVFDEDEKSKIA